MTLKSLVLVAVLAMSSAPAYAQSCQALWYERNSYYKQAGYCFKTLRAIRVFGNAACQYDNERNVPLSAVERTRVNQILRLERALSCSER